MTRASSYSFRRYLKAKRTVDNRSLNRRVRGALLDELSGFSSPVDVLEVGTGIGATIERVIRWDQLPDRVRYTAVDRDPDLIAHVRERLPATLEAESFEVSRRNGTLEVGCAGGKVTIDLIQGDIFEILRESNRTWDLLIAQSFLDLVDIELAVQLFLDVTAPGGLLYFPITFDGGTIFEPPISPPFDDRIERRYHRHMDSRTGPNAGEKGSRAGRHALAKIPSLGGEIVTVGSSDWVVIPRTDGYPSDEDYFLHHILHFIEDALRHDPALDSARFMDWIDTRHRQVGDAQLVYIAHQLDILGLNPER